MVFKIGNLDMTKYIVQPRGLTYTRNDIDGPNAGRAMDGTMYRDRVAVKDKWTVNCRELSDDELSEVLQAIYPEYITVTLTDLRTKQDRVFQAYSNNVPATYSYTYADGETTWNGVSFPIIER